MLKRQHLKLLWITVLLLAAILVGLGDSALQAVIDDGGIGVQGAALLIGIGFFTLPIVGLSVVLWAIWREADDSKWAIALSAAAVWIAGWITSFIFDPGGSQAAEQLIACQTNLPGIIVCGLSRGFFMITRVYTLGYIVAGVVIAAGVAATHWTLTNDR